MCAPPRVGRAREGIAGALTRRKSDTFFTKQICLESVVFFVVIPVIQKFMFKMYYYIDGLSTKTGEFNRHDEGQGRGRQRLLGGRCRRRGSPLLNVVDADWNIVVLCFCLLWLRKTYIIL